MRSPCAVLLAAVLLTQGVVGEARAEGPSAEDLYQDGRKAYRLGDYDGAITKWQESFNLSDQPLLLYNIALAHRGKYDITQDLADLRQARVVLKQFLQVAEPNPDLAGDVADAKTKLGEFDTEIAAAEEREKAKAGRSPAPPPGGRLGDPVKGRKFMIAGGTVLGVGAAMLFTGVGLGVYFIGRTKDFTNLANYKRALTKPCYEGVSTGTQFGPDDPLPSGCAIDTQGEDMLEAYGLRRGGDLRGYLNNYLYAADRGPKAQLRATVSFAVLGGLGLAAVITGAVLMARGSLEKRLAKRVAVYPTPQGLAIRF